MTCVFAGAMHRVTKGTPKSSFGDVLSDPLHEFHFLDHAAGQPKEHLDGIGLATLELVTIQVQKQIGSDKSRSLVAVVERMVLDDSKCIGRGQAWKIGASLIVENVLRPGHGRVKRRWIAEPR